MDNSDHLLEAKFMNISIIKIGSNIIDNPDSLPHFLDLFTRYPGKKILVHGGGVMATKMAKELGIPTQMHQGRRITSPEMLKVAAMVYAGWFNKTIVAGLQARGCLAIGLSGADANLIPAHKRPVADVDYGEVGDIYPNEVNTGVIATFMFKDLVPVICSITHDMEGHLLNTNADTIASTLAIALAPFYHTSLIYCFEQKGVLSNAQNPDSVIPLITRKTYKKLKEDGVVSGGMLPKLENAFLALESGVKEVYIKHALHLCDNKESLLILGE